MQLSKLVYLCVKNAIYYDDTSFLYSNFKNGERDTDPDYSLSINNVFSPLNEAIARLSDLDKLPNHIEKVTTDNDGVINLTECNKEVKEVKNIAIPTNNGFAKIKHIPFGINLVKTNTQNKEVYIEYKEDIPYFDYVPHTDDEDVDLKREYGITDGMCNYIIEYVGAKLTESIDANISNMHITRSEQYFNNLKPTESSLNQQVVHSFYKVGA